ncbi:hypothetical protein LOD99_5177 [Oopsacas minuta]|uniref:Calx-beta domain-containing protein n=1 Tax=Oopsacas minuta TaxID=111878 RepID=A0AAV7JRQ6_9METZ|nr:hypothetical protein LOD99_5177 [Oopsacas minuta]
MEIADLIKHVILLICRSSQGSSFGSQRTRNITILLSDEPYGVVSFDQSSLDVFSPEPSYGTDTNPTLTIRRVGTFGVVNVGWRFIGDISEDFTQAEGVITFLDQVDSVSLELPIVQDEVLEQDEVFQIELVSVDGGARLSSTNTIANLTITLNDIPVYLSCLQNSVSESVGSFFCEFTRGLDSNGSSVGIFSHESTLTISTQAISAASQSDFLAISSSKTLQENTNSCNIEVTILEDTIPEDDEIFQLTLSNPSSDIHLFSSTVDITILGNDGAGGVVSIIDTEDVIAMEGENVRLTLTRSESTVGVVTVDWEVTHRLSNSSSAVDDIYTPGTSSISDGQTQGDLLIPVVADGIPESAEYFTVQLISVTSNIGRLADTELSENFIVRDSDNAYGLFEWGEVGHTITLNPRTLTLQLIRTQGLEFNIIINYNVTYVPAGGDIGNQLLDYVTSPGFTVIQEGVNMTSIDLTIADNAFLEALGRFYATIQSVDIVRTSAIPLLIEPPSSPSIGPRDKLLIPIPEEAINGRIGFTEASRLLSIDEGTSTQPTTVNLTIERDGSAGQATISYVIVKATAADTFSEDDLSQNLFDTIILAEGENSTNLTILVTADDIPELEETFVVTLIASGEQNQQINGASSSSFVTIIASDTPGGTISLSPDSVGPYVVSETTNDVIILTLMRTGALLTNEIVSYMITSNGPRDFYYSGFEIISANEATKEFIITPFDDDLSELEEYFNLTISQVTQNAILVEPTQAAITILENDYPYGVFQFEDITVSASETDPSVTDNSQYNTVQFRVNRDRGTFGNVSVYWSFSSFNAGNDVTPTFGTLQFSEGEDYADFSVFILPDDIPEDVEVLILQLSSPTGGADIQLDRAQAQLLISANDDPITFTTRTLDVAELQGSTAEVTITRGGQAVDRATVKLSTIQDSALENQDYIPYNDFLIVFESGDREKTVSTGIQDDNAPEIEERFYFVLYDATGDSVVDRPYNVSVYIAPNDDPNGIVSFHPQSLIVTGDEGESIDLVIRRTRGTFGQLIITLSLVLVSTNHPDLPASMGDLSFSSDVIIQDGSANTTVTVVISDDGIPELEDLYYISINCPVFVFPPINPGPSCAADNLTSILTVPENDDPYGAYGWSEESLDVYIPEDLLPGAPLTSRDRVLYLSQYGGTLAAAELVWEMTPSLLRGTPLLDLFFYGITGPGVSQYASRSDTGTLAYLFSGQSDSLLTVPSQYQPSPADIMGGFTLSAFIKGSATSGFIMARHSTDVSVVYYGIKMRVSGSTSYLQYEYTVTSSSTTTNTVEAELPVDTFNDTWSHIAVVHQTSPTREAKLYFRGVLLVSTSLMSGGIVADSNAVMSIGADGAGNEGVSLALQDVRVYYAALSLAQIQSISISSPSQDVTPISGYANFSIGQNNASTPVFSVREDDIVEPTEVTHPTILNLKGFGRFLPIERSANFNILASDTGNGIFEFQSLQPVSLEDESNTASIVISRSFSSQGGVYVHWSVYQSDGLTLATLDFTEATGRVLLSDGESLANLILTPVDDELPELAEIFVVTLTGLSGEDGTTPSTPISAYYINTPPEQNISLRIEENDSPYGLFQFDTSGVPAQDNQFIEAATEQPVITVSEETVNISLQVVRAQGTVGQVSVEYFTSSLDAFGIGSDRDYINTAGSLTFSQGQRSQYLTITLVDDAIPELEESFQVILSNPTGLSGKPSLGIGYIINVTIATSDDAFGVFSFRSDSLSRVVSEDDVSTTLYLQRTGGLLGDVTLYWSLTGSNGPTDISPSSGIVYFADGVDNGEIDFSIIQDQISEFLEMFKVEIINVTGGARLSSLGDTQVMISIQASDYPHGLFNFPLGQRSVTVEEGNTFSLTINRQFGTTGDIRVNYSTSIPTLNPATPDQDYTQIDTAYVDFTSGITTRMIDITVLHDTVPEADERFDVLLISAELLSAPQPGMAIPTIDSGAASISEITISENDDARGIFSFTSTQFTVPEPASNFLFVRRSAGLFGTVAVRYTVTLVTAALNDLSSLNGQVTFTEGTSLAALPLTVADDLNPEFDETFTVSLTSPSGGASIASTNFSTVVTISENDDIHGVFGFSIETRSIEVEEPQSIPLSVSLVLERYEGAEGVVRITWEAMIRGGLSAAADISITSGEELFQTQERTNTFSIQILPDTIPEGLEAVEVMIASVTGGARAGDASIATINILPNDAPHGIVSLNSTHFIIPEEEQPYLARIALKREFGNLGDLQITYNTTQLNIIDLAFADLSITESYYFTGPQSLVLTGSQDVLQESDISGSSMPFRECARLCIASYSCAALSHSTTSCILYNVISSQTTTLPSSRSYYEKIRELTDPLMLSIASDGGDYVGTTGADIIIQDGEDTGYIEV